jgi:MoxR-like ATPase
MASTEFTLEQASQRCNDLIDEIETAVIADRSFLETVLLGVFSRGHVLLEDVPGTGKTLTARSFATALDLSFSRIQFTPDLLPADVTGTHIYNEQENSFEFNKGPIFANVILADEINRAPPKTQAAMLEAMGEGQVTVEGETRQLPRPFFVIATQNPVEQEGTFPLPEAQVDRFLAKTSIGFPDIDGYSHLLRRRSNRETQTPGVGKVLEDGEIEKIQHVPETIHVNDDMVTYLSEVSLATSQDNRVEVGISPRGAQRLFEATRARAVINGREFATPDDVRDIAHSVLAHRLVLTAEAQVNDIDKREVIDDVLEEIPVPTVE